MHVQSFLKLGEFSRLIHVYMPVSFQGYGILFKLLKGIWDTKDPFPWPQYVFGYA